MISTQNIAFIFLTCLFVKTSYAQEPAVNASVDKNIIKPGERIVLSIELNYRAGNGKYVSVEWPEIADTITKQIEVISSSKTDTLIKETSGVFNFTQKKLLTITSFDAGKQVIPPFNFIIKSDGDSISTQPIIIDVEDVVVDTTKDIKDIKSVFVVDYSWKDWFKEHQKEIITRLIAGIILIIIIYLIVRFMRGKEIKNAPLPPVKRVPAHIIALARLDELKNEKLWQQGKTKQYYITLTDIVREYIENRFRLQAMEQTTDEILISFRNVAIDEESKGKLKQILVLSDLVKFAKEQPLHTENELSLGNAYDFVNGTKREEELNA